MSTPSPISEHSVKLERPSYEVPVGFAVVRRFNYEVTHMLDVSNAEPEAVKWLGPEYWALFGGWVTLCDTLLRPDYRGLVIMEIPAKLKCHRCRRIAYRSMPAVLSSLTGGIH